MAHGFGEKRETLDHHQCAQPAQHRADQQAGEQGVDHKTIGQHFGQITGRCPALNH